MSNTVKKLKNYKSNNTLLTNIAISLYNRLIEYGTGKLTKDSMLDCIRNYTIAVLEIDHKDKLYHLLIELKTLIETYSYKNDKLLQIANETIDRLKKYCNNNDLDTSIALVAVKEIEDMIAGKITIDVLNDHISLLIRIVRKNSGKYEKLLAILCRYETEIEVTYD